MWISNCKKNLLLKLLNMDKAYDTLIKPLKYDPQGKHSKHNFFLKLRQSQPK